MPVQLTMGHSPEEEEPERLDADDETLYIQPVLPQLEDRIELSAETRQHNYLDLHQLYYRDTGAPLAVKLFSAIEEGKRKTRLKRILRDHREDAITELEEIEWREGFDHLLTWYSVLELALQVGYVPAPTSGQRDGILEILEHAQVRAYYEEYYPLLLPQLLRQRLQGGRYYKAHCGPRQVAALQRVIELESRLLRHPEVQLFLALADDFCVDGYDRQDLLRAVAKPEVLAEHLTRRGKKRTTLDEAMGGLRRFLFLSDGLQRVLQSVEGDRVFQSGLWHLFGYWYAERREAVVPSVRKILNQLEKWPKLATQGEALPPGRRAVELRASIEALASGGYGEAMREGLMPG